MSSSSRVRVVILCGITLAMASARADEVVLKNDSIKPGDFPFEVGDFVAGEHAGAYLTTPCDGAIVRVQIGWSSVLGITEPSTEAAIHIFDEGTLFPTPGASLATFPSPTLTDGAINEFVLATPVRVCAGQSFFVTLEFAHPTSVAAGSASVVRDFDGCSDTSNVLFAIPGGWIDFCAFITGDIVARAVVDCQVCPADLNADSVVNVLDLLLMLGAWGPNPGNLADLNCDQTVNVLDLLIMLGAWGPC